MADRGFGLTITDVRELAVWVVAKSGRELPFLEQDKAGWDWYKGFTARHLQLVEKLNRCQPRESTTAPLKLSRITLRNLQQF